MDVGVAETAYDFGTIHTVNALSHSVHPMVDDAAGRDVPLDDAEPAAKVH